MLSWDNVFLSCIRVYDWLRRWIPWLHSRIWLVETMFFPSFVHVCDWLRRCVPGLRLRIWFVETMRSWVIFTYMIGLDDVFWGGLRSRMWLIETMFSWVAFYLYIWLRSCIPECILVYDWLKRCIPGLLWSTWLPETVFSWVSSTYMIGWDNVFSGCTHGHMLRSSICWDYPVNMHTLPEFRPNKANIAGPTFQANVGPRYKCTSDLRCTIMLALRGANGWPNRWPTMGRLAQRWANMLTHQWANDDLLTIFGFVSQMFTCHSPSDFSVF